MLDLFNFNIGGGGFGQRYSGTATAASRGITPVNLPKPPVLETTKFAKRVVRIFDVAELDFYGVALAFWNSSSDAVKTNVYRFADALFDVAADMHEDGQTFTLVEREVGLISSGMRKELRRAGFVLDNSGEQE